VLLVALLCAAPAGAQRAEANLLFDEGRALMAKREYAQAASKLEQSQQLDPAVGTLLNLAECYVALARTTSAWTTYRDAASLAASTKQPDRERFASKKAQELEGQLSRLEIAVRPEARIAGLAITRDGVPLPEGLWGVSIPVDPGMHHLEAKAPGKVPWSVDAPVGEGGAKVRIEVPLLAASAEPSATSASAAATLAPAPAQTPTVGTAVPVLPPSDAPPDRRAPSPLPLVGWVTMGAGAVVGGAGVAFYALAKFKIGDANCPDNVCVRGTGNKSMHDEGRSFERLGGGLMIVGAAAVATGVIVLLSAPSEPTEQRGHWATSRWQLGATATGLDVRGTW
jgi:hypothetical protein